MQNSHPAIYKILFLSGRDYYTELQHKHNRTWYERAYMAYYEFIEYLTSNPVTVCTGLLSQCNGTGVPRNSRSPGVGLEFNVNGIMLAGLALVSILAIWVPVTYLKMPMPRKQSGGANPLLLADMTKKNMSATGSAISKGAKAAVSLDTYKKGAKAAYSGAKAGAKAGVEAGEYAADKYRENAGGISKIIAFIFLGAGFMMYIFPVLAMGLIGALTFLIARGTIVDIFTL